MQRTGNRFLPRVNALRAFVVLVVVTWAGSLSADTCTCTITVSSVYRWMDPWWGLECNGHCGHGYVGSSCDTWHSTGCGAMTGFIQLRHPDGSVFRERSCPDDHSTCFRGPSGCDSGGSWGTTCSADIWDCRAGGYSGGAFDCNGLSDSGSVPQTVAFGVVFPGACGTNWFNILEFIEENDNPCCDDAMGYLNVSTWTAEGSNVVYLDGSSTNCNGGSQGGVYPHCGRFGATLAAGMTCFTTLSGGGGGGGGEEPPQPLVDMQSHAAWRALERQALAASLPRREQALARSHRSTMEAEVRERALALGMTVDASELTDALLEAEWAELARDRCLVANDQTARLRCRSFEGALEEAQAAFARLAGGRRPAEFQSAAALLGPPPPPVAPGRQP